MANSQRCESRAKITLWKLVLPTAASQRVPPPFGGTEAIGRKADPYPPVTGVVLRA